MAKRKSKLKDDLFSVATVALWTVPLWFLDISFQTLVLGKKDKDLYYKRVISATVFLVCISIVLILKRRIGEDGRRLVRIQ